MPGVRKNDLIVGLAALAGAAVYLGLASEIPHSFLSDPVGAAGLPNTYAAALAVLALLLIAQALAPRRTPIAEPGPDSPGDGTVSHLRALGLLGPAIAYLLLIPILGYVLAIFLLILSVALYAGAPFSVRLVAISAAGGAFMWMVFIQLFSMPLPTGTLWSLAAR